MPRRPKASLSDVEDLVLQTLSIIAWDCLSDLKILPAPFFQTCHILCVENSVLDAIWVIVGEGHFTDDNHSNLNAGLNHWQLDYCDCSSQALLLEA